MQPHSAPRRGGFGPVVDVRGWSLRELYRTLDTPGDNPLRSAQARLDTAERAAFVTDDCVRAALPSP